MQLIRNCNLEELCLQIVIQNLDKFIHSEAIPQKHIDFLHCLYSDELFHQYHYRHHVDEKCMLWFLNPRVKKVTLLIVSEKIIYQLQTIGPVITSLSLRDSLAEENILNAVLCCIPNVTDLDLSGSSCSDRTLLCVGRMCPSLISLNIQKCFSVTLNGLKHLFGGNQSLKNLNILDTHLHDTAVYSILEGIQSLQNLKYCDLPEILYKFWKLKVEGNDFCHNLFNLKELIYHDYSGQFDPIKVIYSWTVMCPNVTRVAILFTISREALELLTRFQKLEELTIAFQRKTLNSLEVAHNNNGDLPHFDILSAFLPKATMLTILRLHDVLISPVILIKYFTNLNVLELDKVWFTKFEDEEAKFVGTKLDILILKRIKLHFCDQKRAVLLLLSTYSRVTKLTLNYFDSMSFEIFDTILNTMKGLSYIDFSYTPIKWSSVERFFCIPSLKVMHLNACYHISVHKIPALWEMKEKPTNSLSWRYWTDLTDYNSSDSSDDSL